MFKKIFITSFLTTMVIGVQAGESGIYIGTDVFRNRLSGIGSTTGLGVYGGYRFGNGAALEVGANRIGRYEIQDTQDTVKFSLNDFNISGIYGVPVTNSVSIFGRLGYGSMRVSEKNRLASRGIEIDSGLMYGIGVNYQFNKTISLRGEFRKPASDINSIGVGLSYTF